MKYYRLTFENYHKGKKSSRQDESLGWLTALSEWDLSMQLWMGAIGGKSDGKLIFNPETFKAKPWFLFLIVFKPTYQTEALKWKVAFSNV